MPSEAEPALAAEFPPATEEQWLALVDKVLKGAPISRLESTTPGGISIHPLYTRSGNPLNERVIGQPGLPPYTRGAGATHADAECPWGVRVLIDSAEPAESAKLAVRGLERGSTELTLRFDEAFRSGLAPSSPDFEMLCGVGGISILDADDLKEALSGVLLDLAPVHIEAGSQYVRAADLLIEVLERSGVASDQVSGGVAADPIGHLATTGNLPQGVDNALSELGSLAARFAEDHQGLRSVAVDTRAYVEAGASEVQELAAMLSTGAAYLRAMADAGVDVDDACGQIEVTLSVDADVFNCVAKLRAARRIWATMTAACGASPGAQAMQLHARTAARMMTRRDPWVNLLRVTAAAFAGGVGGAASVTTATFDSQLGEPVELGRRLARNTQLLLQQESNIGQVTDPMGGSWFIESLTDELATAAWALFQELESAGGLPGVLIDGSLGERIAVVREDRLARVAHRVDAITGVSEFPDVNESAESRPAPDLAGVRERAASRAGADPYSKGDATECAPLVAIRWAQEFERLRDRSDAQLAASGSRPQVFLANIGAVSVHTARATFAKNFFESGGIAATTSSQGSTTGYDATAEGAATAARDAAECGARLACICSSDAIYGDAAVAFAEALRGQGLTVFLAGNPGESRELFSGAGVDEFVHVGANTLDVLQRAHDLLGTPAGAEVLA